MNNKIDTYAVFGNPVNHSKSPLLQAMFADETGESISYTAEQIEIDEFEQSVTDFFDKGGKGLNITVPFKERAFSFADSLTIRAQTAGAVNTLFLNQKNEIVGDNTDGIGLLNDITNNLQWEISNKDCLIVGAGGAVRGIIEPLIKARPASITIVNRTLEKADALAKSFASLSTLHTLSFDQLKDKSFDLIINATSASLSGSMPPLPNSVLKEHTCCYDLMYSKTKTPFIKWAEANGCLLTSDGLGMLVCQGAESFYLWRGIMPTTKKVIFSLRQDL